MRIDMEQEASINEMGLINLTEVKVVYDESDAEVVRSAPVKRQIFPGADVSQESEFIQKLAGVMHNVDTINAFFDLMQQQAPSDRHRDKNEEQRQAALGRINVQ